ncbi:MAG: hypothetical protein AAF251_09755 [Pseudomonadota bacterium]
MNNRSIKRWTRLFCVPAFDCLSGGEVRVLIADRSEIRKTGIAQGILLAKGRVFLALFNSAQASTSSPSAQPKLV